VESDGGEITVTAEENGLRFIFTNTGEKSFKETFVNGVELLRKENEDATTVAAIDLSAETDKKIEIFYPLVQKDKNYVFIFQGHYSTMESRSIELPPVKAKGGIGHIIYPNLEKVYAVTTYNTSTNKVKMTLSDNTWVEKNSSRMKNGKTRVNCYWTHGNDSDEVTWSEEYGWTIGLTDEGINAQMPKTDYSQIEFNKNFNFAYCSTHSVYPDQFFTQISYVFELPAGTGQIHITEWRTKQFLSKIVTIPADKIVHEVARCSVSDVDNSFYIYINLYSDKTFSLSFYDESDNYTWCRYTVGKYTGEIKEGGTIKMTAVGCYAVTEGKVYYDDTSTFTLKLSGNTSPETLNQRSSFPTYFSTDNTLEYTLKYPITF
jgi:hypothetical protein